MSIAATGYSVEPFYSLTMETYTSYVFLEKHSEGNITDVSIVSSRDDNNLTSVLSIPSTINNYPVIKIGIIAFEGKHNITSVTIPSTVQVIDYSAFKGNPLQTVVIGDSVNGSDITYIGTSAFEPGDDENEVDYPGLTSVTIYADSGDVTVDTGAFGNYNISSSWHPVGQ